MGRSPVINVTVTGDAKGLDKAFKNAADGVNNFGGTLKRVFNTTVITAGIDALINAGKAVFDFGAKGVENFDALGDAAALLDANFKGLSAAVDGLDLTKLGFDKLETAQAAKDISNAAAALGLTKKQAEEMVPALTQAAAGYSALTGKSPQEAGALLAKALGGSSKAAKELGIEFTKTMTPADRVNAIMAKYGPLAEDAANGTRSLSDEQATFDAEMANLSTSFGGFLNQYLTPVMSALNKTFFPLLKQFSTAVGPGVTRVMGTLGKVFSGVGKFIASDVVPIIKRLATAVGNQLKPILTAAKGAMKEWQPIFAEVWGWIKKNVVPIITDTLVPVLGQLFTVLFRIVGIVGGALKRVWTAISPVISKVGDILRRVLGLIGDVIRKIASAPIIKDFLNFIGGGSGGGGGSSRAAQGRVSTSAATINVYVQNADPQAVVTAIRHYGTVSGGEPGFRRAIVR